GLLSLPPELLTEILILLPIDEKVVDVGLSCKRLAQFIFTTYSFARMHFQHQHTVYRLSGVSPAPCIADYLHDKQLHTLL
ncbi:hypothetical protein BCR33DRAFT_721928, partial [Rhizoclosmatium globosum]